ncbi:RBP protein [Aspergillus heterothallicus]
MAASAITERTHEGAYRWIVTPEGRAHIASLLGCNVTHITRTATLMAHDRRTCTGCGKPSGLDDLVHNALGQRIHSASFILDVLENGPKNDSPAHELFCSGCGVKHVGEFMWIPSDPW